MGTGPARVSGTTITLEQARTVVDAALAHGTSIATLAGGKIFPVPDGVFVRDGHGTTLGAVGVTGDASLNDEAAAVAGIAAAGLVAVTGAE